MISVRCWLEAPSVYRADLTITQSGVLTPKQNKNMSEKCNIISAKYNNMVDFCYSWII